MQKLFQNLSQYIKDVVAEMHKVSWPERNELFGATVLVIVLSIMMAVFVYACDQVLNKIIGLVFQINM
jgi:preprotein translocase subunit SecE